jgi:hypothetical protein
MSIAAQLLVNGGVPVGCERKVRECLPFGVLPLGAAYLAGAWVGDPGSMGLVMEAGKAHCRYLLSGPQVGLPIFA